MQGDAKVSTMGALWLGNLERIPSSKRLDVLWEVGISVQKMEPTIDIIFCKNFSPFMHVCCRKTLSPIESGGPAGNQAHSCEGKDVSHLHTRFGAWQLGRSERSC